MTITNGDHVEVKKNEDGYPALRVQNTVWVEEPRWINFSVAGRHDNIRAVEDMIHALTTLHARLAALPGTDKENPA